MSSRNTLIFLLVLAALAGYWSLTSREGETDSGTPTPTASQRLWERLTATEIVGIRLTDNRTGGVVELRNNEGAWAVVQPTSELADSSRATTAATQLAGLIVSRTLSETADLSGFGLLNPHYVFEVEKASGEKLLATIGEKTAVGNSYYALRSGEGYAVLLGGGSVDALAGLITQPPYPPTPTPQPTPAREPNR